MSRFTLPENHEQLVSRW